MNKCPLTENVETYSCHRCGQKGHLITIGDTDYCCDCVIPKPDIAKQAERVACMLYDKRIITRPQHIRTTAALIKAALEEG